MEAWCSTAAWGFRAVDRNSGKVLWSRKLGSGIVGNPITYKVDGNQYVSVYAGIGGWVGLPVAAGLDMNDKFGAIGATAIAKASGLNLIPSRRAARSTPLDSRPTRHEVRTPDKRFRVWSLSLPDAACSHATLT